MGASSPRPADRGGGGYRRPLAGGWDGSALRRALPGAHAGGDVGRAPMVDDPLNKARGENFPVALRLLPERTRRDLQAIYRFARHVDDIGDDTTRSVPEKLRTLDALAADVRGLYDGSRTPADPIVAALASPIARRRMPAHAFLRLIEANRRDQHVVRYQTFDDLLDYCRLSANPVGELVLCVFGRATPERIELSDRICTALQLIEHWQDIGEDYRRSRVYLPQEDMASFGVAESDLARQEASPALRALIAFETERAEAFLHAGTPLLSGLSGWARIAVSGYLAGGRAACRALRRSEYDPLRRVPKPTSPQIAAAWLSGALKGWA